MKFLKDATITYEAIESQLRAAVEKKLKSTVKLDTTLNVNLKMSKLFPKIDIKPKVHFSATAYQKIQMLIKNSGKELAWHGIVNREGDDYYIEDVLVYPQSVTAVTVESDDDAYPMWTMSVSDEDFKRMRMQGHSHVNMPVSPSSVDEMYMDEMLTQVNDYYIFMIMNKRDNIWMELVDVKNNCIFETKDIEITFAPSEIDVWAAEQIDKYIKPLIKIAHTPGITIQSDDYTNDAWWEQYNNRRGQW